jgi:hypothetical protein
MWLHYTARVLGRGGGNGLNLLLHHNLWWMDVMSDG